MRRHRLSVAAISLLIVGAWTAWSDWTARQEQQEAAVANAVMKGADAVLKGADARIESNRKADGVVRVIDLAGKPVSAAKVSIQQTRHAFLFGCNLFRLFNCESASMEGSYEREFASLFNYATLDFYWDTYEPVAGKTRADLQQRQARWCKAHGIEVKGHPLIWFRACPRWVSADPDRVFAGVQRRVTDLVTQYAGLIDRWDVVNEATQFGSTFMGIGISEFGDNNGIRRWIKRDGAGTVTSEALGWAAAANSRAQLLYNDYESPEYERLAAALVARHAPLSALGIQSHMHLGEWPITKVWDVCERYARSGTPLHFTEVTVLSGKHGWHSGRNWPSTPEGEARQADYVEKLYTVLFSHAAVQAITWWDFPDGGWAGCRAPGGLVHSDLTPKPAYWRLLALIKRKWWTHAELTTDTRGEVRFRGFLGQYKITVSTARGVVAADMTVARGASNTVVIRVQ